MNSYNLSRPILIGCAPSSGSTLLSLMLDSHPNVFCGPELSILSHPCIFYEPWDFFKEKFLSNVFSEISYKDNCFLNFNSGLCPYSLIYEDNLQYYGFNLNDLINLVQSCESVKEFIDSLFVKKLEDTGKIIWSEKTPTNLYSFKSFLNYFPEGRVISIVRDGRDVVCSLISRGFSFANAISIWLLETAFCMQIRQHPRAKIIRYEDLVTNPKSTLYELTDFLNIPSAIDDMMSYYFKSDRISNDSSIKVKNWKNFPDQPPSNSSIGRWKKELNSEQLALFNYFYINNFHIESEFNELNTENILAFYQYESNSNFELNTNWEDLIKYIPNKKFISKEEVEISHFHNYYVEIDSELPLISLSANDILKLAETLTRKDQELENYKQNYQKFKKYNEEYLNQKDDEINKLNQKIKLMLLDIEILNIEKDYLSKNITKK